mmetsp:Transcript_12757/g.24750  ORF Transcript_12757/g.24750 Transcript_12757/m.24750 type:complete len:185 (-) Transcript_12757:177-731(-)|eukprot:CAMPEP_0171484846 /NCGR_PEP_ID=MMETSP0958-20121227/227_1 /TAXON_ID=87120 /ORGANISM="Aurantiochytrium limacinum, Strain ATCCMYA-1381" /LENGTH=184 /DNA_ID=CAMNT_0012017591 /DNA_START=120 /DNA_END=674 /DNA_ORIENTATION=-
MAAALFVKRGLPISALMIAETYALANFQELLPAPVQGSSVFAIPKLYGLVALFNVVGTTFTLLKLSMKVGEARKKYDIKAPTMYAEGTSDEATQFNCVQRGHQNALETYPSFVALSLIGGLRHPVVTSLCGLLWSASRIKWAEGYAKGSDKRYSDHFLGVHIWTALVGVIFTSVSASFGILNIF